MKKKIYVVGGAIGYTRWIDDVTIVGNIEDADIVFFTGGEDVSPKYYNCRRHSSTWSNPARDEREFKILSLIKPTQLVIGICRGAQFLTVANGGLLVQDVTNHGIRGCHDLKLVSSLKGVNLLDEMIITSLHHQMMYPYDLCEKDYTLLYKAFNVRSPYYEGDGMTDERRAKIRANGEPEIVIYHKNDMPICLAIQGHPEMMGADNVTIDTLNEIVSYLLNIVKNEN